MLTAMSLHHGRPWTVSDRTGGQLDDVFDQLRERVPGLVVERLEVTHPADDDNVYFIGSQDQADCIQADCIQVDTPPGGRPPFLIENGGRHQTTDTVEAVTIIENWLCGRSHPAQSAQDNIL
jgi:hypothetical protein